MGNQYSVDCDCSYSIQDIFILFINLFTFVRKMALKIAIVLVCVGYAVGAIHPSPYHPAPYAPAPYAPAPYHPAPKPYHPPPPAYKPAPYHPEKIPPKPFAYEYGVKDEYSGANFGQNEVQDEYGTVTGEYRVLLPDGRTQIVSYTADHEHGYVAEVTYEGVAHYEPYHPKPAPYHPKPAPYHAPKPAPYHPLPKPAPYHPKPAPYHPAPYHPKPAPYHPAPVYHPSPAPYHV